VDVSDMPEEMLPDEPFVAVAAPGADHGKFLSRAWITKSSAGVTLDAPTEPGEYEVRAYAKRGVTAETNLVGTARISVR
jgi:hypothetical protein